MKSLREHLQYLAESKYDPKTIQQVDKLYSLKKAAYGMLTKRNQREIEKIVNPNRREYLLSAIEERDIQKQWLGFGRDELKLIQDAIDKDRSRYEIIEWGPGINGKIQVLGKMTGLYTKAEIEEVKKNHEKRKKQQIKNYYSLRPEQMSMVDEISIKKIG